ncbi:MAG TPA: hypothetical protein VJ599_04995 [Nitrososphaeraceae archaeon]|nr:hypothetical protein [Nitrososphaeraceae archaeon]
MGVWKILQKELEDSELWLGREKEESTYRRDLRKRIELINWILVNIKLPQSEICDLIETKMNKLISKINESDSIIESDKLHNELRILNWILYQVSSNKENV